MGSKEQLERVAPLYKELPSRPDPPSVEELLFLSLRDKDKEETGEVIRPPCS